MHVTCWAKPDYASAHLTAMSSYSYAHASKASFISTFIAAGWSVLHLDDEPDDMVSPRGSGWQALALYYLSDAPASQVGNAWRCYPSTIKGLKHINCVIRHNLHVGKSAWSTKKTYVLAFTCCLAPTVRCSNALLVLLPA